MGYSCSAAASMTQKAMLRELELDKLATSGNGWKHNGQEYFLEQGRENPDGAITGTVYRVKDGYCYRSGGVRIEKNGIITRWPCVPQEYIKRAEAIGAARFIQCYGQRQADFEGLLKAV
jgi:hypothetical protein